jgi:hypothetical protein
MARDEKLVRENGSAHADEELEAADESSTPAYGGITIPKERYLYFETWVMKDSAAGGISCLRKLDLAHSTKL